MQSSFVLNKYLYYNLTKKEHTISNSGKSFITFYNEISAGTSPWTPATSGTYITYNTLNPSTIVNDYDDKTTPSSATPSLLNYYDYFEEPVKFLIESDVYGPYNTLSDLSIPDSTILTRSTYIEYYRGTYIYPKTKTFLFELSRSPSSTTITAAIADSTTIKTFRLLINGSTVSLGYIPVGLTVAPHSLSMSSIITLNQGDTWDLQFALSSSPSVLIGSHLSLSFTELK